MTRCAQCGEVLIRRVGFSVTANKVSGAKCPVCSTPVAGIF